MGMTERLPLWARCLRGAGLGLCTGAVFWNWVGIVSFEHGEVYVIIGAVLILPAIFWVIGTGLRSDYKSLHRKEEWKAQLDKPLPEERSEP